jgi:hypothetical protein
MPEEKMVEFMQDAYIQIGFEGPRPKFFESQLTLMIGVDQYEAINVYSKKSIPNR